MNNYSKMNYMPDDFDYINRMYNFGMPNQQQVNMMMQKSKISEDQILKQKLAKQAGDNMNFNKCGYDQENIEPNTLYDPYGGFIRGNMFPDIYNQFKISKPFEIEPMSERGQLLTYLDAYCFAAHDLNLFLDNHPDNQEMIALFAKYTKKASELKKEYESKYGPLLVDASTTCPWAWNKAPWPWENN